MATAEHTPASSADISSAELGVLDAVTPGTVAASKAVVVDANKDISSFRNLTATGTGTIGTAAITDLQVGGTSIKPFYQPGVHASGSIRIEADVVEAETVTVGSDVYEFEVVNTDSTDNTANGDFNNTTDPLTLATFTTDYANVTPVAVGDLIRIENEIMRVTAADGTSRTFARGQSGTTTATHADATDIFDGDGIDGASTIAVGLVATLTPTAATDALIADINGQGTEAVTAIDIDANEILLVSDTVGAVATSLAEGMGGVNNAVDATLAGGAAAGLKRMAAISRVPTTQEVGHANMHFVLPFDPTVVLVEIRTTSSGARVLWNGDVIITSAAGGNPAYVTLNNDGATDWTANETVSIVAFE